LVTTTERDSKGKAAEAAKLGTFEMTAVTGWSVELTARTKTVSD